ncbi:MAG: 6-phosphofructokinase, partial [Candidatus Cloacimonetes bacterium HGW-Cloacimonetes-1]
FTESTEVGAMKQKLGGIAMQVSHELKEAGCQIEIRETILGHLQRGGRPNAFDRVLATQFGVKAFELALEEKWGHMVAYKHPDIVAVPIQDAIRHYNLVDVNSDIIKTARGVGICFGD